ncbi:MAG: CHRD domain-containing protein [Dongiaceae bacterium]
MPWRGLPPCFCRWPARPARPRRRPRRPRAPPGPQPAAAATEFEATLTGPQTVPPTASIGTGRALLTLDGDRTLHWRIEHRGLSAVITAARFHGPAAPGTVAPAVLDAGVAGLASPIEGSAPLDAGQLAALAAGRWYVEIDTRMHPDGEIRGQLRPAP